MGLPKFHRGQVKVYRELQRFNLLLAGRRWRKSTFGAAYLSRYAWLNRGQYLWGSPTHDQNKIAFSYMEKIFSGKDVSFNRSAMIIELPNRSIIRLRSLNKPDNCRGFTIDGVVIDEVAYTSEGAYKEVIRPTLMDTLGWSLLISTPAGFNWIYDLFHSFSNGFAKWCIPSFGVRLEGNELTREPHLYENPHLLYSELLSLLDTMGSIAFRQEILCEFLSDGLNPFVNIDELCSLPEKSESKTPTIAGLDFAKTVDYTVLSIFDPRTMSEVACIKFPHGQYVAQCERIREFCIKYNITHICFDNTGVGNAVVEILYPKVMDLNIGLQPFTFSNISKVALINDLILAMEKKKIYFTDFDDGIYEFRRYTREQSGNTIKYGAMTGSHDDVVTARALSLRMLKMLNYYH